MPCQQNNPGTAERKLVSVSGSRCLVSWSVVPVDADSFDTILDAVRAGKYETIVIATIKKNGRHIKVTMHNNNQKLIVNNDLPPSWICDKKLSLFGFRGGKRSKSCMHELTAWINHWMLLVQVLQAGVASYRVCWCS